LHDGHGRFSIVDPSLRSPLSGHGMEADEPAEPPNSVLLGHVFVLARVRGPDCQESAVKLQRGEDGQLKLVSDRCAAIVAVEHRISQWAP
jgi:hypothetical protein